jgi:hypothetical protein
MLWRGVELQEPLGSMLSPTIYSAWTLAPDFVSDEALARIRSDNLEWEGESQATWTAILDYVVERMRTTGAILVVPDSMARTTDPAFDRFRKSDYFAVGTTPYYVAREPDSAAVEAAWRDAGSAAGEMAILTLADVPTAEAGESELDTLARLAIDIVIEAYDHPQRAVFFSADAAADAAAVTA